MSASILFSKALRNSCNPCRNPRSKVNKLMVENIEKMMLFQMNAA